MTENMFQTIWTVVLSFTFVVLLAYFTTKYIANATYINRKAKNMKIIESLAIGREKFLLLIRVSKKVLLVSVAKDTVNLLSTFDEEEVDLGETQEENQKLEFGSVIHRLMNKK